jgi:hypothetical protein
VEQVGDLKRKHTLTWKTQTSVQLTKAARRHRRTAYQYLDSSGSGKGIFTRKQTLKQTLPRVDKEACNAKLSSSAEPIELANVRRTVIGRSIGSKRRRRHDDDTGFEVPGRSVRRWNLREAQVEQMDVRKEALKESGRLVLETLQFTTPHDTTKQKSASLHRYDLATLSDVYSLRGTDATGSKCTP